MKQFMKLTVVCALLVLWGRTAGGTFPCSFEICRTAMKAVLGTHKPLIAPSLLNLGDNSKLQEVGVATQLAGRAVQNVGIAHIDLMHAPGGRATRILPAGSQDTLSKLTTHAIHGMELELIRRSASQIYWDIHFMVDYDPDHPKFLRGLIDEYSGRDADGEPWAVSGSGSESESGAFVARHNIIPGICTIHWEGFDDKAILLEHLQYIQKRAMLAGLAVNPGTEFGPVADFIMENQEAVDLFLQMTVEPGDGGKGFQPQGLVNIQTLRDRGYEGLVEIDGGVNQATIAQAKAYAPDITVMGTAYFEGNVWLADPASFAASDGFEAPFRTYRELLIP